MPTKYKVDPTLDEQKTWQFLKDAFRPCGYCGAPHRAQEIQQFMPIMGDGFIFCTHCSAYLGVWEEKEGVFLKPL